MTKMIAIKGDIATQKADAIVNVAVIQMLIFLIMEEIRIQKKK